jgi:hypothetical protein
VHAVSASAREKIEAAGGTIELLREPKERKARPQKRGPKQAPAAAAEAPGADATDDAAETPEE